MADAVNVVWNYCNAAQLHALKHNQKWPNGAKFQELTRGSSGELGLLAQSIQAVCDEYEKARRRTGRQKLRWRNKRSLGWVPFKNQTIVAVDSAVRLSGLKIKLWQHREIQGRIKSGNFSQDARGRWYCNLVCEVEPQTTSRSKIVGIDLGFKTVATAFNAPDLDQARFYRDLEPKLAEAQRKSRRRQVRSIHAKIANRRKDALHKYSRAVVNDAGAVFVGNISSTWQIKSGKGKATLDVSWSMLRNLLKYKCDHAGVAYAEVNESYTTQTCSDCGSIGGPKGAEGLEVRQWVCSCGAVHNRDLNAAVNIARLGCETLGLKWPGSPALGVGRHHLDIMPQNNL